MQNRQNENALKSCSLWHNRFFYVWIVTIMVVIVFSTGFAFAAYDAYSIHIGSYKKMDNARNMVSLATSKGLKSVIADKDDPNGGVWHRVYVGHYNSKQEAQKDLLQVQKKNLSNYYAVMQISDKAFSASPSTPTATSKVSLTQSPKSNSSYVNTSAKNPQPIISVKKPASTMHSSTRLPVQNYNAEARNAQIPNASPFTLSLTSGWSFLPNIDEFRISQSTAPSTIWYIGSDGTGFIGMDANYQISDIISIQGGVKTELFDNIKLYYVELGPKISSHFSNNLEGYLRAGIVYGNFDWDTVPGNFDDSYGWLVGSGLTYKYHNFCIGLEASYRNIEFEYSAPAGVTANQNDIDFSGALLTGTLGYHF